MVTIVDYGMGNVGSLRNMFKRIGVATHVTGDSREISRAAKLLLPGVGAFDSAMSRIERAGLREVLERKALVEKVPILGICLGMQLLTLGSEEGRLPGLGWIEAKAFRFPVDRRHKVPHMGWNTVIDAGPSPLLRSMTEDTRFYFVHSYYVRVKDEADAILKAEHSTIFDAAIAHQNIYGVQFHPEKSHQYGMRLLANFAAL